MAELDLLTKFNRGLCLALVEKNPYEALQMYRQYISYLHTKDSEESYKKELKAARDAFLKKLIAFVKDENNKEKYSDLIAAYQGLLVEFPNESYLHKSCSEIFKKLEQYDMEFELLLIAEKNDPENLKIKEALYKCCKNNKNYEKALECAKYLVEKEKDNPYYYFLLGLIYDSLYDTNNNENDLKNAVLNTEIAYKLDNTNKMYPRALIILYTKAHDEEKLKAVWDYFLKNFELSSDDKFVYAAYLVRHGDFKKGYEVYESRFTSSYYKDVPVTQIPQYDGKKDISQKALLVQSEQGMGDVFLCARFLKLIKGKARRILVRVPVSTYAIIKRSFPEFEVLTNDITVGVDYCLPMMSFMRILNITKDNIPIRKDYLVSDKEKNERFKKELFNNNKFKIGITFKGKEGVFETRNVPIKEFIPLTKMPNVEVYSLQYGIEDEEFEGTGIINLANKIKSFDDTASMIENMDLIVCSDNAVMNLAGGLGKRTFCLFNDIPEFRWFDLSGEDVKWYETVKPYQVKKQNAWAPVFEKIVKDIEAMR